MKAHPLYQCKLCGRRFELPGSVTFRKDSEEAKVLAMYAQKERVPHDCGNGGAGPRIGVGEPIGLRVEEER